MKATDLEKQRSQYAFRCVKGVWEEYKNAKKKFEEIKRKEKEEIDCTKKENEKKEICKKLQKFKSKEKLAKNYKSYIKKIPMMILNNGLGATFAFMFSKKTDGNAYELIYKQINNWFVEYIETKKGPCNNDNNEECPNKEERCENIDLVEWIICLKSNEYRATTNEVLALFKWWRRFVDGMIELEENND